MRYFSKAMLVASAALCLNLSAYSQDISLKINNVTVKEAMERVKKDTGYSFVFSSKDVNTSQRVSVSVSDASIEEVIKQILKGQQGLDYEIQGKKIVLRKTVSSSASQDKKTVSGKVVDANGEPVIGATIMEKGTTNGTITDFDGNFVLNVVDGAQLEVSYVGFKSQDIKAVHGKNLAVTLREDSELLDEVVVVGYGTQLKKNLSSSISKIDTEHLNNSSSPSFESMLQGRAAGVQVTTGSAMGGSTVSIRIRGTSSVSASSEPLYVIDGVPMETGSINESSIGSAVGDYNLQTAGKTNILASINPNDIESLEILKDAAAASIYGSRGANGVVLITTKRGKSGKVNVSTSLNWSISTAAHKPKLLNSKQYIELAQEAWMNSGNDINEFWEKSGVLKDGLTKEQAMNTNTNWVNETLRMGFSQDYNVSISGGSDKLLFYLSGNMKDDKTILIGNHYQKFSARANLESQLNNIFRVGGNMFFTHTNDQQAPISWDGGVGKVTYMLPIWPVYKEDGSYFNLTQDHPVAGVYERDINLQSNQFVGNWFLKAQIMDGFSFRTDIGVNTISNDDFHYKSGDIVWTKRPTSATIIGRRISWNWKNVLNYSKIIDKHNIDVVLAQEMQKNKFHSNTLIGDGFFNSAMTKPQDADIKKPYYIDNEYAFMSFIGRVNYSYKDTYLLSLSMRSDGSSRFAPNKRWGYFPAASLGYTISNENFFKSIKDVVNLLKFRASYGIVGNAEIGNYLYYNSYNTILYNGMTGIVAENIGDPNLGWEETSQLDFGIDVEFLKGRISLTFDYYDKKTKDLLLPYPVSALTGVDKVTRNIGELMNRGFEFSLNTINIENKDFTWTSSLNLAHNKNKVIKLNEKSFVGSGGISNIEVHEGYPVGARLRPIWAGVDPATGEDMYLKLDGTKVLYSEAVKEYGSFKTFASENDKPTGNPYPKISGGFNNSLTYKNWNLSFLFNFAVGMDYNLGMERRSLAAFGSSKYNPYITILDRWQKPGDIASVSKLTTDNIEWTETTETLHRTDFLRLKELTLGYTFPMKGKSIKGLSCYLKGTNLLTFTKAPDSFWDPEWTLTGSPLEQGNGDATAPQARSVILGLKINF